MKEKEFKENNLKLSDFNLLEKLGNGRFGEVWLAEDKKTKITFAFKMLEVARLKKKDDIRSLRREINIHLAIIHRNILQMFGYFRDKDKILLAVEYAPKGDLWGYVHKHGKFEEPYRKKIIKEVCDAVKYLHDGNIIHRDIKPENILLDENLSVKLCDFGWSVCNIDKKRKTLCGTTEYLSPEMLLEEVHDKPIDIWCIGILLFELFTGETPFGSSKTISEMKNSVLSKEIKFPENINPVAIDFIRKCCAKDPKRRYTIDQLLSHKYLTG